MVRLPTDPPPPADTEDEGDDNTFVADVLDDEEAEVPGGPEAKQPPASETEPEGAKKPSLAPKPDDQAQPRKPDGTFDEKPKAPAEKPGQGLAPEKGAPAAEHPPTTTEEPKPWTFRADEREWAVDGAQLEADGSLRIPKERIPEVADLLGQGIAHRGSFRQVLAQKDRELAEAKAAATYETQRAQEIVDVLVAKVEAQLKYDRSEGRDGKAELQEFLQNLATEWPVLKLAAAEKAHEAERKQFLAGRSREQRTQEAQQLDAALWHHVGEIAAQHPGVDPKQVFGRLRRRTRSLFFRAERDMPEAQLRAGELGVLLGEIDQEFADVEEITRSARAAEDAAKQVEKANAARVQGSKAPPGVAAGGAPVPGPKEPTIPVFKTRAERDAWLNDPKRRHKDLGTE